MVERWNASQNNAIHTAMAERRQPQEVLDELIISYRNTPYATTSEKPSKLLFNRNLQTKLPGYPDKPSGKHHQDARLRD